MDKILITGTGRSGTTFLIKLFSFLDFDTGYTKENYHKSIFKNCNSGMEKKINASNYILKNPLFLETIENIYNDDKYNIKYVIIPIRDYRKSAMSRVSHKNNKGGLWKAKDLSQQILYYNKIMSNYIYMMAKYEINTILLDFDKMVNDSQYLYDKLKIILDEKDITFDKFLEEYNFASETSKP